MKKKDDVSPGTSTSKASDTLSDCYLCIKMFVSPPFDNGFSKRKDYVQIGSIFHFRVDYFSEGI